jgi:starch synthase
LRKTEERAEPRAAVVKHNQAKLCRHASAREGAIQMKVLYAASEALPFAAFGGLAKAAGSLSHAMRMRLIGCRVVLPLYQDIPDDMRKKLVFLTSFSVPVAWRRQYCGVFRTLHNGVVYYLLDNQYYFRRPGLYGHFDDAERFAFFSRAVLEMLAHIDFEPEIIHFNDWQCALGPVYYSLYYSDLEQYKDIKTVFTIHNIQFQGKYGMEILEDVFGISGESSHVVEFNGVINLMKGGIKAADCVTTLSPTYAKEILEPWHSHGLDGVLKEKSDRLHGILSGIDTDEYNPETDTLIWSNYSLKDMSGKPENKRLLQERLGLPQRPEVPIIAMIPRLIPQKGMELVKSTLEELLQKDVQFILQGSGDWAYESFFREIHTRYRDKMCYISGFIPELARKIYAGADIYLKPSRTEPCGEGQMISCRYGTVPVVRETGGLKDSITDCGGGKGTGFTFREFNSEDMMNAVCRALESYQDKGFWSALMARCMSCDFSWGHSANQYIRLYRSLLRT